MSQITTNKQTSSKTNQARRFDAIASAALECEFCGVELNDSTGVVANADGQLFCSDECCTDGAMWQEVEKLYAERERAATVGCGYASANPTRRIDLRHEQVMVR